MKGRIFILSLGIAIAAMFSARPAAAQCPPQGSSGCAPALTGSDGIPLFTPDSTPDPEEERERAREERERERELQRELDRVNNSTPSYLPAAGSGPDNGPRPTVNPGPAVSDVRDKKLPPELSPLQKEAQKLLDDARDLAKSKVDCNALRSTYRSGPQRVMPSECVTDLDRATTYIPGQAPPQPSGHRIEDIIDGSNIPSTIDFSKSAIERIFVGPPAPPLTPPPPPSPVPEKPVNLPEPRISEFPLPGSTVPRPAADNGAAGGDNDGPTAKLEVLPTPEPSEKSRLIEIGERVFGAPAKPGPIRQVGAPDDTQENHQADMNKATDGRNYVKNPLKYPLEIQRTVNDKMNRILEVQPPEGK